MGLMSEASGQSAAGICRADCFGVAGSEARDDSMLHNTGAPG